MIKDVITREFYCGEFKVKVSTAKFDTFHLYINHPIGIEGDEEESTSIIKYKTIDDLIFLLNKVKEYYDGNKK